MEDKEHRAFFSIIEETTNSLEIVSTTRGVKSVESLVTIIRCLGDTNNEAVKVLKRWKADIFDNKELCELLVDFYKYNHKIVELLNAVEEWLNGSTGISWRLELVKAALQRFKGQKTKIGIQCKSALLEKRMGEFLVATNDDENNKATEKMYAALTAVLVDQQGLRQRLRGVNGGLTHQAIARLKVFRKVSTIILTTIYVGLLVCASVVAVLTPALVILPLAAIAAIANMNPTEHMEKMMDHIWDKYEKKLEEKAEFMNSMILKKNRLTMADLENIRGLIQELQEKVKGFSLNDVGLVKDPVVKSMVKEVEKNIDEFGRVVKDLQNEKDKCYNKVLAAKKKMMGMT